jgi:hypothetical protein
MSYSFNSITKVADCDALLLLANREKSEINYSIDTITRRINSMTNSAADLAADLAEVQAKLTTAETIIASLPDGDAKEEAITERMGLEYRLRVLNDRIDNYGAVALLQRENELEVQNAALDRQEIFITEIQNRRAQIGA